MAVPGAGEECDPPLRVLALDDLRVSANSVAGSGPGALTNAGRL